MSGRRTLAEGVAKGVLVATMAGMTPAITQAIITPSVAYAATATVSTATEFDDALHNPTIDTIELNANIDMTANTYYTATDGSGRIKIDRSLTINGNNHTVTVAQRGFGVGVEASSNVDVTFKDVIINNNQQRGRCIDTRGNLGTLTIDHTTLSTAGISGRHAQWDQPLTIGGNQSTTATVIICNGSEIKTSEDGTAYYAITTFNPVDVTIDNSTIKGWACIYAQGKNGSAGSAGSTYNITNSTLVSKNAYSGATNAFSAIKLDDSDITINISNTDINISATGDQQHAIATQTENKTGNVVNLQKGTTVTFADDEQDAEEAVFYYNTNILQISGGKFNRKVPAECAADGYEPTEDVLSGNNPYTVDHEVASDTANEAEPNKAYLQINKTDDNDNQTYKVYQLFTADVTDDNLTGNKLASNIAWADDDTKAAVLAYLDGLAENAYGTWLAANHPGDGQHDLAQNAAEFIASQISGSNMAAGTNTTPRTTAGNSFANGLAVALANNADVPKAGRVAAGAILELPTKGYYLVTSESIPNGYAGTAPIWLPWTAAEGVTDITPKTALPTLTKEVKEGDSSFGEIADAGLGDAVNFKITATLPENYGAYGTYSLNITDIIPNALTLDENSVTVTHVPANSEASAVTLPISNETVYHAVDSAHAPGGTLVVNFTNLSQIDGLSAGDSIVVTYTAALNGNAAIGLSDAALDANTNTARLTYSNDPDNTVSTGTTEDTASVATYQINVLKVDKGTDAPLSEIKFTLKQGDKYVQEDGSLGDEAHPFATGNDGKFSIPRIDAGTYILDELDPLPAGYKAIKNVSVTISSSLSGTPSLTITTDNDSVAAEPSTENGTVSLKVSNTKEIVLPITGMTPSQLATALGMVLLAAGTVLMVVYVSKKQKER